MEDDLKFFENLRMASISSIGMTVLKNNLTKISTSGDGGPRSRVCTHKTLRSAPK